MVQLTASESERIRILLDGIPIINATSLSVDRSRSITKVDVIGTPNKRIGNGTLEYSGSITELRTDDLALRLVRSRIATGTDIQGKAFDGVSDILVGEKQVVDVINAGNLSHDHLFTATGTKLTNLRFLAARNGAFTEDVTVEIRNQSGTVLIKSFTVLNDEFDVGTPTFANVEIPYTDQVTTIPGTVYMVRVSVASTSGTLTLYGGDRIEYTLIGVGDAVTTNFDLDDATVDSSTLYVRLDADTFLGQEEGYSFGNNTGTLGVDEVIFAVPPASGVEIYAKYEYTDAQPAAMKLVFANAPNPVYTIKYELYNEDRTKLLDSFELENVRFTSNGVSVSPASFVEQTLQFEATGENVLV